MKAIGNGGEWWWNIPSLRRKSDSRRRGRRNTDPRGRRRAPPREPLSSSSSSESIEQGGGWPIEFPFRQAVTAASLTFTGDTIAQVRSRIVDRRRYCPDSDTKVTHPLCHAPYAFECLADLVVFFNTPSVPNYKTLL
jgi:protein Mpv17